MDIGEHEVETWTVVVDADLSALQNQMRVASSLGRQFSSSLVKAFDGIAVKGKSLSDVFKGLALDLSQMVVKAAFKPIEQGLGNAFSSLFTSGSFATGNAAQLAPALPIPFAKGGIINSPIGFPLAGGSFGLAGESGAEAILPLGRARDGSLGIKAQGGAGNSVVINISTPDIEGFNRSQTQVAAMLARAVSAGQRNL